MLLKAGRQLSRVFGFNAPELKTKAEAIVKDMNQKLLTASPVTPNSTPQNHSPDTSAEKWQNYNANSDQKSEKKSKFDDVIPLLETYRDQKKTEIIRKLKSVSDQLIMSEGKVANANTKPQLQKWHNSFVQGLDEYNEILKDKNLSREVQ